MRRGLAWAGLAVLVAALGGAVLWLAYGRPKSASGSTASDAPATTTVRATRRNLAETQTESGTLEYSDPRSVVAQTRGTVTAVAGEGTIRRRGQVLFRVDNMPTVLMYGTVPAWRPLSAGVADGPDVRELEWNLVALGYDPARDVAIDEHWTSATTAAVKRWQKALGVPVTGVVNPGDVVFLPGRRRIGEVTAARGTVVQPGSEVLTATRTTQQVTVDLDTADQTLAVQGEKVSVDLPDGSSVPGRIDTVGTVAQSSSDSSAAAANGSDTTGTTSTIEVDVTLLRPTGEDLDQAPVDVNLTTESRKHVVSVPVTALVALLGGGYAVETPTASGSKLVAVEPGLYGDGYVEIVRGLRVGDRVLVPQQQ